MVIGTKLRVIAWTFASIVAVIVWAVIAMGIGQVAASFAVSRFFAGDLFDLLHAFDGAVITVLTLISNTVTAIILVIGVWLSRAKVREFLGLKAPEGRYVLRSLIGLVILIPLCDAALFLIGAPLVTPFQTQSYTSALNEGWIVAFWFATIIVAPAGEEFIFRGFLFGGLAGSKYSVWPAIVAIALVWASLHSGQYDWPYIAEIAVIGIFLGWMRWRSGSTLLTMLLHMLFNLEGTIETVLRLKFFP
jgi:membrane protease YdiL (CAAX protease family)